MKLFPDPNFLKLSWDLLNNPPYKTIIAYNTNTKLPSLMLKNSS